MMQSAKIMGYMMADLTQYLMLPQIRYAQGIGTYVSYNIAAYDGLERDIVTVISDVTSDRNLALRMTGRFNKYQLNPCHLEEVILDMLT